ncbi:MAG: hypothetical protein ACI3Z9_04940 [Candidatus Onthomorpha sp.]
MEKTQIKQPAKAKVHKELQNADLFLQNAVSFALKRRFMTVEKAFYFGGFKLFENQSFAKR